MVHVRVVGVQCLVAHLTATNQERSTRNKQEMQDHDAHHCGLQYSEATGVVKTSRHN